MAKFYGDEEDPPCAEGASVRYYTPSEIERAYIESVRYVQSLEEYIADHFKEQHRDLHEVSA